MCRDAELEKVISGRLWQKNCQVRSTLSYSLKIKGGSEGGREGRGVEKGERQGREDEGRKKWKGQ